VFFRWHYFYSGRSEVMEERILRADAVAQRMGCSIRTVWRRVAEQLLPKPVKDVGCTGWPESEISQYIEKRKQERRR
jgi:predicted DNA-binding transcriptional regulator AlpA